MNHKKITAIFLVLSLVFITACNLQFKETGGPTQDSADLVNQAVQQTFQAQTQVAQAVQQTLAAMGATAAPLQFTETPSLTSASGVPMVHVTTDTNCRVGPGLVYDIVEGLMVGEQAEVHGVDPDHSFWYIRNDGAPAVA